MLKPEDFIMMPVPSSAYGAVCAVLSGLAVVSVAGNAAGGIAAAPSGAASPPDNGAGASPVVATDDGANAPVDDGRGLTVVANEDGANAGEIDAHGHPWSADLHASTKGKTKDGLWRMKVGVSRPDPLPGFPADGNTGTSAETDTTSATLPAATEPAPVPTATAGAEDDEFASFRAAAAASDAGDAAAAAAVPERQYTDADLGALCNQAAVKLGDPSPVKEIIAAYVPQGEVAHSRNIPADKRAEFVKAVEAKAGVEFAG